MKLLKFRVLNFRSIKDSTWIDCDNVTNIIGVNEAGKSNALLALWKLNPARDGKINLLEDLPRNKYSEWKTSCDDIPFIQTYFQIDETDDLMSSLVKVTGRSIDELSLLYLERRYNNKYYYEFPNEKTISELSPDELIGLVEQTKEEIEQITPSTKKEITYQKSCIGGINKLLDKLHTSKAITPENIFIFKECISLKSKPSSKSSIVDKMHKLINHLDELNKTIHSKPIKSEAVWELIFQNMPTFVYYSNYGNLDSEIYLPHVIDNLSRTDISGVAAAKARTLRVLFEFINLEPQEILSLGSDGQNPNGHTLTDSEIKTFSKKKEERTVLLNSASAKLTKAFKHWWKQGNYVFDLRADGKFFKIWVSDEIRPEKIALESRSTGLQWFLSFYLIFLVETQNKLKNSILLMDEAGLSLHPLAQKDLLGFFKSLSEHNQIIHTTHSPFLVDTENIDNVKLAYVDSEGYTVLSNDLRANTDPRTSQSIYAVHAALGLNVSDILLTGCTPVIVEGASDQYYLYAMKNYLISSGKWQPKSELVFMPAGGVKGVSAIASIISTSNTLPFVILDSDSSGENFKNKLIKDLYKEQPEKIISIGDIIDKEHAEIEDIIPINCLIKPINKLFSSLDEDDDFDFIDIYSPSESIINQVERLASENNIILPKGYKVDLAKIVKKKIISMKKTNEFEAQWIALFKKLR